MIEIIQWAAVAWVVHSIGLEIYINRDRFRMSGYWLQKVQCVKCFTFWSVLTFTGSIFIAATASLIIHAMENLKNDNYEI